MTDVGIWCSTLVCENHTANTSPHDIPSVSALYVPSLHLYYFCRKFLFLFSNVYRCSCFSISSTLHSTSAHLITVLCSKHHCTHCEVIGGWNIGVLLSKLPMRPKKICAKISGHMVLNIVRSICWNNIAIFTMYLLYTGVADLQAPLINALCSS